jgi:hypothetical protein
MCERFSAAGRQYGAASVSSVHPIISKHGLSSAAKISPFAEGHNELIHGEQHQTFHGN